MTEPILVTSHVARDFLQNSTYFNTVPKVVWEYVSNSIDNPKLNTPVQVDVSISKERLVIADSASGMSRQQLQNFFTMHGENIRRTQGAHVRGRYGTGKCAAFGIADVLRVETVKDGLINIVELDRGEILKLGTGDSFPVKDVTVNGDSALQDGTTIIVSRLNLKNIELQSTVAFVERHLGRQLQNNMVVINGHLCEYQEPYSSWQRHFQSNHELRTVIGDIQLVVKVSPTSLDRERAGIDILSNTIWHETWAGSLEGEISKRVFGEVDVPILEDNYDDEKIPPFDNTRNMTLNQSNPRVSRLLGWIDECLHEVAQEIQENERARRATEEAKRLEKQAAAIEQLLNADFKSLELELERIKRKAKALNESEGIQELVPGMGDEDSGYQLGLAMT